VTGLACDPRRRSRPALRDRRGSQPPRLTATFVVSRSERPRTNGIAFLSGFLLGTAIACGLGLALGQAAVDRLDSHETIEGVLT
jgi:hypothetical protein